MTAAKFALPVLLAASLTMPAWAQDAASPAAGAESAAAAPPVGRGPGYPPEMMARMQEMRQQQMEMMRSRGMPMMGPGAGMMSPEMQQQMQAMREQHRQMMQSQAAGRPQPPEPPQSPAVDAPAATDAPADAMAGGPMMPGGPGGCMQRHGGYGKQGVGKEMRQQMMAKRMQHMQAMEQRLANIEELLRQMVEMQQGR